VDRNEKTIELIRRYQKGEDTRNEIIELNMPLVHFFVKKLKPHDMEYEDAVSITMLAFSKAIENFEIDRELKFVTYANAKVMSAIQ
jgi:RNA polymerase sporulation-specific sigma factor